MQNKRFVCALPSYTTHGYVEADTKMKRQALENSGTIKPDSGYTWKPTDDMKAFLDSLGVK